jgi:hypothetical protein
MIPLPSPPWPSGRSSFARAVWSSPFSVASGQDDSTAWKSCGGSNAIPNWCSRQARYTTRSGADVPRREPDGAGPMQRISTHHPPGLACRPRHGGTRHRVCALCAGLLRHGAAVGRCDREGPRAVSRRALVHPGRFRSTTLVVGGTPPADAHELLGWWVIPITLLAGWGVKYASDRVARWAIGRHRRRSR